MNKKMLEMAQQEYQKQFNVWVESQPNKTRVYDQYARLEKYIKNSQSISNCPLKRVECMGGECTEHYECKNENHYHTRGSNAKESLKK